MKETFLPNTRLSAKGWKAKGSSLMKAASISIILLMLALPVSHTLASTQPTYITISGSVVGPGGYWSETLPKIQVSPGLWEQTTISINTTQSSTSAGGAQPLITCPCEMSSQESMTWTNVLGVAMYTQDVLEVNVNAQGVITGVGICNGPSNCSTGYVSNGEAQCSGPGSTSYGQGGTIAWTEEAQGGAEGVITAQGIASWPAVQYNSASDTWSYMSPDSTSWWYLGSYCTGWSYSFPSF